MANGNHERRDAPGSVLGAVSQVVGILSAVVGLLAALRGKPELVPPVCLLLFVFLAAYALFDFCDALFHEYRGYAAVMVVATLAFLVVNAWGACYLLTGQAAPRPTWYLVSAGVSAVLVGLYAVHDFADAVYYQYPGWRPVTISAVIALLVAGLLAALTTGLV